MPKNTTKKTAATKTAKKTAAKKTANKARTSEETANANLQEHAKTPSSSGAATAPTPNKDARKEIKVGEPINIPLLVLPEGSELQPVGWQVRQKQGDASTRVLLSHANVQGIGAAKDTENGKTYFLEVARKDWESRLPVGSYTLSATFTQNGSFQGFSTSLVVVDS